MKLQVKGKRKRQKEKAKVILWKNSSFRLFPFGLVMEE